MKLLSQVCVVLGAGMAAGGGLAQTSPAPVAPSRIDQSIQEIQKKDAAPTANVQPAASAAVVIEKLAQVSVQSTLLAQSISDYWLPYIGKAVTVEKQAEFKAWLLEQLQQEGYLAYVETTPVRLADGSGVALNVVVTQAVVGSVRMQVNGGKGVEQYVDEVVRRFATQFQKGSPVDVRGMDAHLSAIAFDLPVDLSINVVPLTGREVEVEVTMQPLDATPGKLLGGAVQLNNYGVSSFGRNQLMGIARIAGFTPNSELDLSFLAAEGSRYIKALYEMPISNTQSRVHAWVSDMRAHSDNIVYKTQEIGAGVTRMLTVSRNGTNKLGVDVSQRDNQKLVSDFDESHPLDSQLRVRLVSEFTNSPIGSINNEAAVVFGNMDLSRNAADLQADAVSPQVHGHYQKIEVAGSLKQTFGLERAHTFAMRWRAQVADRNLHGLDQFSLGGMDGVRAFSSAEGNADNGVTLSLDLGTTAWLPTIYTGVFYDAGMAVGRARGLAATPASYYNPVVQGVGFKLAGSVQRLQWNLAVAKSYGDAPDYTFTNISTKVGDVRVGVDVTYPF